MNKILPIICAGLLLAGCKTHSVNRDLSAGDFSVDPDPLTYSEGAIAATIRVNIPAQSVGKTDVFTLEPVLHSPSAQFAADQSVTLQGEKVESYHTIVGYTHGRSLNLPVSFAYQPDMDGATLAMRLYRGEQADPSHLLRTIELGVPIFTTPLLLAYTPGGMPEESDQSPLANGKRYLLQGRYALGCVILEQEDKGNTALLAQILNQNYVAAQTLLETIDSPDALTHYLAALLAARTANETALTTHLNSLRQSGSPLAQRVLTDIEFQAYRQLVTNLMK